MKILSIQSGLFFLIAAIHMGCNPAKNTSSFPKPEMIFIKGGTFTMGDVIDTTNSDALPLHEVSVSDYYIAQTEVTFEQYDAFAKRTERPLPNDRNFGRGNRAVVYVNWHDASAYCNFFGWRLPTEAEWEYAARDRGMNMKFAGTNNSDSLDLFAITDNSNMLFSYFVASKKPNALGLFDMSGNVMEYVGSFYQKYDSPDNFYPIEERGVRILRGGSFQESVETAQTFWRVGSYDLMTHSDVGFRCAVSQKELNEQRFLNGLFHEKQKTP